MRLGFVVVAVVLGLAGSARADNREEARKEFALGQQADKDKDYQTAIEHYLRAYELVPHHFALFNIATAYERLGQLREASQWFERYLDEAPASLTKERREVEKLIIELKLRPAKLTVTSTPAGARVVLDGQPAGVTPFTKAIRGGGHRVRVELEGQREERDVVLEYAEPQTVQITLDVPARPTGGPGGEGPGATPIRPTRATATSGTLVVTGTQGALVAVDDQVIGRIPGQFAVEPGDHKVNVTLYGYQPHDETVHVTTGLPTRIVATLTPGTTSPKAGDAIFGYYLGAAGGADARGEGGIFMGELGYRVMVVDIAARIGRATGHTAIDVVFRWSVLKSRLTPFIVAGYVVQTGEEAAGMSSSSRTGYLLGGGLRYDVMRGATSAVSVLAETGVRLVAGGDTDDKTVFVPLLASVQLTFGAKTNR